MTRCMDSPLFCLQEHSVTHYYMLPKILSTVYFIHKINVCYATEKVSRPIVCNTNNINHMKSVILGNRHTNRHTDTQTKYCKRMRAEG